MSALLSKHSKAKPFKISKTHTPIFFGIQRFFHDFQHVFLFPPNPLEELENYKIKRSNNTNEQKKPGHDIGEDDLNDIFNEDFLTCL